MKNYLLVAGLIVLASVSYLGASHVRADAKKSESDEGFKVIRVADLAKMMKTHKKIYVFDANTESTRTESGLIPGAVPMDSVSHYDPSQLLPPDKNASVIFYCHSTS